jgi:hypothetical protein
MRVVKDRVDSTVGGRDASRCYLFGRVLLEELARINRMVSLSVFSRASACFSRMMETFSLQQ